MISYLSIAIACQVIAMLLLSSSCSSGKKNLAKAIEERDSFPVMKTLGVTTVVSDSGVSRYRITAEEWLMFDRKNPPYWAFEKGVYLEKFDSLYRIEANIKADTAYFYERRRLWELRGNVKINSLRGEKFETQQLFWDQNSQQVYSDKYIRIEQKDKIIAGYGFESNQQMTKYKIMNSEGIFTVDEQSGNTQKKDSVK